MWSDGTAVDYRNWAAGEPNSWGGREHYAEFVPQSSQWNDGGVRGGHALAGFVCGPADLSSPPPPPSADGFTRFALQLSWHDARDHCRALGRDLASVHSADENEAIWRLTGGQSDWIGMSDEVNERTAETGILTLPAHVD